MRLPAPKSWKEYPKYMLGYWVIIWAIAFTALFFLDMDDITPDGKYFRNVPCLQGETTGRYDEGYECYEYGEPEYIPLGKEFKARFIRGGVITGIIVGLIGSYGMYMQRKEEKNNHHEN